MHAAARIRAWRLKSKPGARNRFEANHYSYISADKRKSSRLTGVRAARWWIQTRKVSPRIGRCPSSGVSTAAKGYLLPALPGRAKVLISAEFAVAGLVCALALEYWNFSEPGSFL